MDPLTTQILDTFKSFFVIPDIPINMVLIGLGIAILFGAIWIATFYPPLSKHPWLWVILVASFFSTAILTAFLQIPLQYGVTKFFDIFLSHQNMQTYILIVGVPTMIVAAIVQIGARLLPVLIYWLANKRTMEPRTALYFGAFAGLGPAIIEAFQVHSQLFAYGWDVSLIQYNGLISLLPFIERFFIIGLHTCAIAIAAYGLAKGKWWQFVLIIVALDFVLNYITVLLGIQVLGAVYAEIIIFVLAALTVAAALWLRWSKTKNSIPETSTAGRKSTK